ncbi:MAG TPA: hypothetical protein VN622_04025 [Clostridia bacterium]|nr:hypothetical protein [Clostridia bacterium]
MKRAVAIALTLLLCCGVVLASDKDKKRKDKPGNSIDEVLGDWEGSMKLHGERMKVVLHIVRDKDSVRVTVDSPDQSQYGVEGMRFAYYNARLRFDMPKLGAIYEGRIPWGPTRMEGIFSQGSDSASLTLFKLGSPADAGASPDVPVVTGEFLGDWEGLLDIGQRKLRFVLHVRRGAGGTRATADSPDQDTFGIAVPELSNTEKAFRFSIPEINAKFEGTIDGFASTIRGTFTQNGKPTPLMLSKQ